MSLCVSVEGFEVVSQQSDLPFKFLQNEFRGTWSNGQEVEENGEEDLQNWR
jgi:hypothetical protein